MPSVPGGQLIECVVFGYSQCDRCVPKTHRRTLLRTVNDGPVTVPLGCPLGYTRCYRCVAEAPIRTLSATVSNCPVTDVLGCPSSVRASRRHEESARSSHRWPPPPLGCLKVRTSRSARDEQSVVAPDIRLSWDTRAAELDNSKIAGREHEYHENCHTQRNSNYGQRAPGGGVPSRISGLLRGMKE